ncbi:hypothetical protein [Streptomyces sp. CRPSP2-6A1]|nr:hypothetical protein [Streptomyces sp. CRPSP2-6A1]
MVHQQKVALTGSAHLELVSGVVQLRSEDAMFDAMRAAGGLSRSHGA